jgi:hypothetical protein
MDRPRCARGLLTSTYNDEGVWAVVIESDEVRGGRIWVDRSVVGDVPVNNPYGKAVEFTYESTYEHRDEDGWRYRYRVINVRALPPEINPEA